MNKREERAKRYLSALMEIHKELTTEGGSVSMVKICRKNKLPSCLGTVLVANKILTKTGERNGTKYFWNVPVRPNIKMAEITMEEAEKYLGRYTPGKEKKPVKKEDDSHEVTVDPNVDLRDFTPEPSRECASAPEKEIVREYISDCKPLELELIFLWGLFKYRKIQN